MRGRRRRKRGREEQGTPREHCPLGGGETDGCDGGGGGRDA